MSSWPLISDFARVLQNPQVAFRLPEWKQSAVEMNQLGQPKARSGNFATVYRGFRPDGSEFAIRVFNRRQDERLEHYRTVSEYLETRSVSSIVDFEYDPRGIRSAGDGKMYPLLTMEWVPGITLFEWARDRSREGYAEALQIAADVWLHLVRELQANEIVHGDLQHGNIMVSPEGHFKLVDYDCMCVPALIGRRNLETGLPPYQHPGRTADTRLFAGLDNFSSLVIYVALRALAAAPRLWSTYVDQPEYDRMLFRTEDFQNPAGSALYHELLNSPDEQVRDLTHYLFELVKYDLHDVPPVDEVLLWCESIDGLVASRDWDRVVQLVERMGPDEQVPPDQQALVQEAQARVACREAMQQALEQGDEDRVEQLFATGLLRDYPAAAHLLEPASRASEVRPILRILESARQLRAWDKLRSTWQEHQHLLRGRASAKPLEREIQKLLTVDRIQELLAARPVDDRGVADAWTYLQQLGGHPLADPYRPQIERSLVRQEGLAKLQELLAQAPQTPTLAQDKKLTTALPPEAVEELDPAAPLVQQYRAAQRRMELVRQVHERERAGTVEAEAFIANVVRQLPAGYHDGLAKRSQQAGKRLYIYRQLERVIADGSSEAEIVHNWDKLGKVRGRVLADESVQQRVQLAEARLSRLEQLRQLPAELEPAQREQRVLEIWDQAILDGCHEAAEWSDVYRRVQERRRAIERLEQALEEGDLRQTEHLLRDPRLHDQPLSPELARQVHELRERAKQAAIADRQALVNTLLEHDRRGFVRLFDTAIVADICRQYRHHQPVVSQWLEAEILPADKIGISADPAAVTRDESGRLTIRWKWPPSRISDHCHLRICRKPPLPHVVPEDVPAVYSASVACDQWDPERGWELQLEPDWEHCRVYVWAVVDLGFQRFTSEPVLIGEIDPLPKQRRWSLFGRGRKGGSPQAADRGPADPPASRSAEEGPPGEEEPPRDDPPGPNGPPAGRPPSP